MILISILILKRIFYLIYEYEYLKIMKITKINYIESIKYEYNLNFINFLYC